MRLEFNEEYKRITNFKKALFLKYFYARYILSYYNNYTT